MKYFRVVVWQDCVNFVYYKNLSQDILAAHLAYYLMNINTFGLKQCSLKTEKLQNYITPPPPNLVQSYPPPNDHNFDKLKSTISEDAFTKFIFSFSDHMGFEKIFKKIISIYSLKKFDPRWWLNQKPRISRFDLVNLYLHYLRMHLHKLQVFLYGQLALETTLKQF